MFCWLARVSPTSSLRLIAIAWLNQLAVFIYYVGGWCGVLTVDTSMSDSIYSGIVTRAFSRSQALRQQRKAITCQVSCRVVVARPNRLYGAFH